LKDEYLGPAFIRRFDEGDILYGSRRTYLRKVVIAPFSGITSNTTFVAKANEEKIDKRLLPFIMMSEGFTENSIKNSKGSVNPYINWKDIAKYEILLPPKDQQAQLAKLLWAMDEVIEKEKEVLRKIIVAYITRREYLISEGGFEKNALLNLTKNLITYGIVQPGPEVPNGVPYIQSSDIKNSEISRDLSKTSNEIAQSYSRSDVVPGDVIFSLRGNLGDTAIVPSDFGKTNMARGVARISLNEDCDNLYIKYALETKPVLGKILAVSQGSTFKEVSLDTLRKIKVPVPEGLERQIEISSILKLMVKTKSLQESKISISQSLQKSLINQVF
jgi:type I restriction enzyme S subunit